MTDKPNPAAPRVEPPPRVELLAQRNRCVAVANALRDWINAAPLVKDQHGNPTISPVYGAHVLLCDLIDQCYPPLPAAGEEPRR